VDGYHYLFFFIFFYLQSKMSLMGASLGNSVAVVQRLLDLGKDPNEKDKVLILLLFDFGKVYIGIVSAEYLIVLVSEVPITLFYFVRVI